MAMVVDAFVSIFAQRLADLVESEVTLLLGVERDLQSKLQSLSGLVADAESKRIRDQSVSSWLARLRELLYDADDLLDDCRIAAETPGTARRGGISSLLGCFRPIATRHKIGTRIRLISENLKRLSEETGLIGLVRSLPERAVTVQTLVKTSSIIVENDIVGFDEDARDLVGLLTRGSGRKHPVYALTGMPGIRKTTLAQKVFHDPQVKSHFQLMLWIRVSKECEYVDLLKQIARSASQDDRKRDKGEIYGNADTWVELDWIVRGLVDGKRYLLLLDDVWDATVWEMLRVPLYSAGNESRVLITTRNEEVANLIGAVHIHRVRQLSDKECWIMLCKMVFGDGVISKRTRYWRRAVRRLP